MDKEVLTKFLSNKCSYSECESIARILASDEHELDRVEMFEHLTEDSLITVSANDKKVVLRAILPIKSAAGHVVKLLVAAAALLFLMFSFFRLEHDDRPKQGGGVAWVNLENTESGSTQWYLLPDSSRVKLEPDAHIRYPLDFTKGREIHQLAGAVTYYVQSDSLHPFRVLNQGVETRALGTIFTVADYDSENLMVKLLEGKIAIADQDKNAMDQVLLRDQATLIVNKANYNYRLIKEEKPTYADVWKKKQQAETTSFSSGSIAWSNRVVNFSGVSNADLFSIMERLFSVTIDIENPEITNGNFTGQLYQNDNLEDLLTIFCEINGCTFTTKDNIIKIK